MSNIHVMPSTPENLALIREMREAFNACVQAKAAEIADRTGLGMQYVTSLVMGALLNVMCDGLATKAVMSGVECSDEMYSRWATRLMNDVRAMQNEIHQTKTGEIN